MSNNMDIPLVALRAVSKVYPMGNVGVRALDSVTLTLERGAFAVILGPSGSGKTTLMDVVGCLARPTSGEYLFNGDPVLSLSDAEMAAMRNKTLGFVFQTFYLLPRYTALMNVALPLFYNGTAKPERLARAQEVLQRVGLGNRMNHLPRELSGGQQQRVAIARALVNQPEMILADEPTGNLDSQSGADIIDLLVQLHHEGITLLMITHDMEIAKKAPRRITLKDGRIVEDVRV